MKRKTILIGIGIVLILFISAITALYLHFKPLLEDEEMKDVVSNLMGTCIGKGCHSTGSSSTSGFGSVDCRGYQFFYICLSDAEKYCRYFKPFESREKCVCEVKSTIESKDSFKKFCPRNSLCYGNSFEYEFGCSEDLERTCREIENRLRTEKSCSYCEDSWVERYPKLTVSEKERVNRQFESFCNLFCQNCNSTICTKDNLCVYYNLNQTATKTVEI